MAPAVRVCVCVYVGGVFVRAWLGNSCSSLSSDNWTTTAMSEIATLEQLKLDWPAVMVEVMTWTRLIWPR